ncbi:MAG: DNA polymerase I [Desulfovibrio sp.]|jgi:DNA polymerase-1|nr:DNA polymerase I [Desulfovibrio sp.]
MSLLQGLKFSAPPVFLVDGSAFIFRGFFGNAALRTSNGFPTGAIVTVTRLLMRILREEQPRYMIFLRDGRGKNFRHEIFPQYKANREATPEDLVRQIPPVETFVKSLGIRLEVTVDCEADDCIASLAERFQATNPVVIVSGDKDLKQCLAPQVVMWDPSAKKEEKLVTVESFTEETGIQPSRWPDMQAITGDASDNIPGVPGIGPKNALELFSICKSLEEIRERFTLLPQKFRKRLADHLDDILLYRQLTTLRRDALPDLTLEDIAVRPMDVETCQAMCREYELYAMNREMAALHNLRQSREGSMGLGMAGAPLPPPRPETPGPQETPAAETARADGEGSEDEKTPMDAVTMAWQTGASSMPSIAASGADLPDLASTLDLPDPRTVAAALYLPEGGKLSPHLAVVDRSHIEGDSTEGTIEEWRWTGPADPLLVYLAKVGLLVAVDVKDLLRRHEGFRPDPSRCFDLGLADYLVNPEENDHSWKRLTAQWGGSFAATERGPGALALRMAAALRRRLADDGLLDLYRNLELPLIPVLADMERAGLAIDPAAFKVFRKEVEEEIDRLTRQVHEAAGEDFNLRSAKQLGEVLFDRLGLASSQKTKSGQSSTSQQALEKLAGKHPVVDLMLQHRKYEKLRSTYLDPLPNLADNQGRIHTTFNQKATATGRLSSSNPNLQNIPIRGPMGKRMRGCFIPAPGNCMVSADYSQVELRVLAHMSQDPALRQAFADGEDIHLRTATLIFDLPADQITPDQRRSAKTINFGLLYGMGPQKLAQELNVTIGQAKEFIARYFEKLSTLKAFYDAVEADAKRQRYVTTLGGRRRWVPDILSTNNQVFATARRQAINTVIQGSAADIIKLAMLAVADDARLRDLKARMVLQIHDELLLECPIGTGDDVGGRTAQLMEKVAPGGVTLSVPLVVDWGVGANWGDAH